MKFLQLVRGFTLLEMLVALTVAAVLTTVSLHVYSMFHHGILESSNKYVLFATERAKDLRCRTRFVRGISLNAPPCDSADRAQSLPRTDIRARF